MENNPTNIERPEDTTATILTFNKSVSESTEDIPGNPRAIFNAVVLSFSLFFIILTVSFNMIEKGQGKVPLLCVWFKWFLFSSKVLIICYSYSVYSEARCL